jgi:hypothetical protein
MGVFFVVLFITFGVFGFIPTCHYICRFGFEHAFTGRRSCFVTQTECKGLSFKTN